MKQIILKLLAVFVSTACVVPSFGQYTLFTPKDAFAIEVSLPNTKMTRLPVNRNAISSLYVLGDYIVGGTSAKAGLTPFVFVASLSEKKMKNIKELDETVSGQNSIPTGFLRGSGNELYAGTMPNKNGSRSADGHIIKVMISADGTITISDMGAPVPGEGIFSLIRNGKNGLFYGISYPSGLFFKYNVDSKEVKVFKDLVPSKTDMSTISEYAIGPNEFLGKCLIQDDQGKIYGSMPINRVFCFDPKEDSFKVLDQEIPEVWGRRTMGQIESWAKGKDGKLYGGNAGDGQLFVLDPATLKMKNLGKPIMMTRLRGLTFGSDGKLYGIAGAQPGYAHLFSYDQDNGFKDFGNPEFRMVAPGIEQGILWRGFQLGTISSSEDGKYIVMGEDESLSQLMIFQVHAQ